MKHKDNFHDKPYNSTIHEKIESVQNKSFLALTRTISDISKEKLYQELGLKHYFL